MDKREPHPTHSGAESGSPAVITPSGPIGRDDGNQAVWEWSVDTGKFGTKVTTARVRALVEGAGKLKLAEPRGDGNSVEQDKASTGKPYDRALPPRRERETRGGDPYSRGPARSPEAVTFNPHAFRPCRKS